LEKIIIEPSPFSDNKNLPNLRLLLAIRAKRSKVVGCITKLQNYNASEIDTELVYAYAKTDHLHDM